MTDIREAGVSLVRVAHVGVIEFQEIAAVILKESGAKEIRAALLAQAGEVREMAEDDGYRQLCVKDDPVRNDPKLPDNEAHAVIVATRRISDLDAKEIRDSLLEIFSMAGYLNEVWAA